MPDAGDSEMKTQSTVLWGMLSVMLTRFDFLYYKGARMEKLYKIDSRPVVLSPIINRQKDSKSNGNFIFF